MAPPHFRHTDLTGDRAILQTHSDAEFKHSIRQRYVALATDDDTGSASSAQSSPSAYPSSTSSALPGISQSLLHGHHSSDSVAEIVATVASAMMPNVVGDDWHSRPERAN